MTLLKADWTAVIWAGAVKLCATKTAYDRTDVDADDIRLAEGPAMATGFSGVKDVLLTSVEFLRGHERGDQDPELN